MDSIIKPLNEKVKAVSEHVAEVVRGLQRGDPAAKQQVQSLFQTVRFLKADFKSTVNSMNASHKNSIKTMAGLYNPGPMVSVIAFFLTEVLAAVQLLANLLKLIASLISIITVLMVQVMDLEKMYALFNRKALWLSRALTRTKEKGIKNIEWIRRSAVIQPTTAFLNSQKKAYTKLIDNINAKYSSPTTNTSTTEIKVSPDDKRVIDEANSKIDDIDAELNGLENEQFMYIPNDKKYYYAKWKLEEEQDTALLTTKHVKGADEK